MSMIGELIDYEDGDDDYDDKQSDVSSLSSDESDHIIICDEISVKPQPNPKPASQRKKFIPIERICVEEEEENNAINTCSNCKINYELLILVQNLTLKLNNIENELKELKELSKSKSTSQPQLQHSIPMLNKKTDVLQWLNTYIHPSISFDDFIDELIVNPSHFEFLMEFKLTDTIQKIIQTNIGKKEEFIYPLYSTTEKCGKVYIYTENDTWEVITIDYLTKFVKQIENKLSKICVEWKNKHSKKNNFDNDLNYKCQSAITKLYDISYTQDATMNRIRSDLYTQLKNTCKYNF